MKLDRPFPSRDQLSIITAAIILAYALGRFLELPQRVIATTLFGSALGFELSGPFLMLLFAAALISAGSEMIIRAHPLFAGQPARRTLIHWILPGATALVMGAALDHVANSPLWWVGLGFSVVALLVVLIAEYVVVDPADPRREIAALALTTLAYLLALILFILLRRLGARAAISATLGGGVAAALTLRLSALKFAPLWRSALFAGLVGLISAFTIWLLHFWAISATGAALLTMIPFYVGGGLAQQHLLGRLTRKVWIEFGVVGALVLVLALIWGRN